MVVLENYTATTHTKVLAPPKECLLGNRVVVVSMSSSSISNLPAMSVITTTDFDGNVTVWPGSLHVDLTLGAQPMLLPIPPSWSAITAIETDVAPEDWRELEDRIPTPSDPVWPDSPRSNLLQRTLLGEFSDAALGNLNYPGDSNGVPHSFRYQRLGHNRAIATFVFDDAEHLSPSIYNSYDETQKGLNGSTWVFELTFTSDGAAQYTLTITKEGELPTVAESIADFTGAGIDLDEFPNELTLPDNPPQASGEDLSGVEVAAAITAPQIGANDVQTFLVSNAGVAYSPGDWLEPKDGGNQRMMIVGAGPSLRQPSPLFLQTFLHSDCTNEP